MLTPVSMQGLGKLFAPRLEGKAMILLAILQGALRHKVDPWQSRLMQRQREPKLRDTLCNPLWPGLSITLGSTNGIPLLRKLGYIRRSF